MKPICRYSDIQRSIFLTSFNAFILKFPVAPGEGNPLSSFLKLQKSFSAQRNLMTFIPCSSSKYIIAKIMEPFFYLRLINVGPLTARIFGGSLVKFRMCANRHINN